MRIERMEEERFRTETNRSAVVLSVGLLGDALLYLLLPVSYAEFGVTSIWVGILLSANRFVRIAANRRVTAAARRFGLGSIMLAGIILATASTLSYGLVSGGAALLAARIAWGVSFAMLRLGSLGYATDGSPGAVGGRLGRSASIAQLGSLFAVTAGGPIAEMLGIRETFIMFGIVSMFAIPIAMSLPRVGHTPYRPERETILHRPNAVESTMGIVAMGADGLCIVTLVLLLMSQGYGRLEAIATGGILLGVRQVALTIAPTVGGWLADRLGIERVLPGILLSIVAGLVVMAAGSAAAGFLVVCNGAAIVSTLLPGVAAGRQGGDRLGRISSVVTWRDLGAAVGALMTGVLLPAIDLSRLYLIAIALLSLATWWLRVDLGASQTGVSSPHPLPEHPDTTISGSQSGAAHRERNPTTTP